MKTNIEISIGRNKYNISCQEDKKDEVYECADRLNKRVNTISMMIGRVSDIICLFLAGIMIQRQINKISNPKATKNNFYKELLENTKKFNNIFPFKNVVNTKEERERIFISCIMLENQLYNLDKNYRNYSECEDENHNTNTTNVTEEDIISVIEVCDKVADSINKLAITLNEC